MPNIIGLGIDLTTVTRAYTEARRRGIMEARVGQGSFVSETSARRALDLFLPALPAPLTARARAHCSALDSPRRSGV